MPIVGFSISKIEAERLKALTSGEINVSNNPRIISIEEDEIVLDPKRKEKILKMNFEFVTSYEPKIGSIKMSGNILFMHSEHDKILKEWKKDKALPGEVAVEVMNVLFRKCLTKILVLAEDLQLPPSIGFPTARLGEDIPMPGQPGKKMKDSGYIK